MPLGSVRLRVSPHAPEQGNGIQAGWGGAGRGITHIKHTRHVKKAISDENKRESKKQKTRMLGTCIYLNIRKGTP